MKISVVGLGKLGSPILAVLSSKEHLVTGVDLNPMFIDKINQGLAPVEEPNLQNLLTQYRGNYSATADYRSAILSTDVTIIIVPTPSGKDGTFINDYILDAMNIIGSILTEKEGYHLLVIKSTVMPGSTGGIIQRTLEITSGKTVGRDLGLCYSPEFIALGSVVHNLLNPDIVLIGESDQKAGDILEELYISVCDNIPKIKRMNYVNAEISKIAINTFVTTKISYANMLSDLCQHIEDADVDVVTSTVGSDSRIGTKYIRAGLAFGGPCFPRDNIAFSVLAQSVGANAELAIATQNINKHQNIRLLSLVEEHCINKSISLIGLSYKPGTPVVEESQAIYLANSLAKEGFQVNVYDPMANDEAKKYLDKDIHVADSLNTCIASSEFLVVLTPWPNFATEIDESQLFGKKVIDAWRVLNITSENVDIIYLGKGATAEAVRG